MDIYKRLHLTSHWPLRSCCYLFRSACYQFKYAFLHVA